MGPEVLMVPNTLEEWCFFMSGMWFGMVILTIVCTRLPPRRGR
jgi:hypothetical protein